MQNLFLNEDRVIRILRLSEEQDRRPLKSIHNNLTACCTNIFQSANNQASNTRRVVALPIRTIVSPLPIRPASPLLFNRVFCYII